VLGAEPAAARLIRRSDRALDAGRFAEGERLARGAVSELLGRPTRTALRCAAERSLGSALRSQARYREAERHLQRAVRWARSVGPIELAASWNALGMLCKYTARYAEAARLYRAALAVLEVAYGARDLRLAPVLHNLGGIEHARGRHARGEVFARRGLAIRRRARVRDAELIARDEVALGALLEGQGKLGAATRLYRRALRVFERARGGLPYEVAVTCNNLGAIAYARSRLVDADRWYRRSIRLKQRLLGDGHPDVAVTRNNLAAVIAAQGRPAAARALYLRALVVLEHAHGADSRLARICRANLADVSPTPAPRASRTGRAKR
jgi:tetratricopeptide (TPR) repeat protein